MANRFPITVNTSTNKLEELPISDNINLTSSGIYDGSSTGSNGQILTSTGFGVSWKSASFLDSLGSIDNHSDVVISNASSGQVLKFNGTNWINGTDSGGAIVLDGLNDVTITSPSSGNLLRYNGTNWYNWSPTYISSTGSINTHTDVTILSASSNQLLRFDGTKWYNWTPDFLTSYTETDTLASVTSRGASTSTTVTFQDVNISGTLSVIGTTATTNTTTLNVSDTSIVLNSGQASPVLSASIKVDRGSSSDVSILWNEVSDVWQFTNNGTTFYKLPTSTQDLTNDSGFITSTGSINSHTDVSITNPQVGEVLAWSGSSWINAQGLDVGTGTISGSVSGVKFIQSTTPTATESQEGDLWFDNSMSGLFVYTKTDQSLDPATYVWVQI